MAATPFIDHAATIRPDKCIASPDNKVTLGPTDFILGYLESHNDVTSAQIREAYSEHLGRDCNRYNITRRLKVLSHQRRIVRRGESGRYLYSGVEE